MNDNNNKLTLKADPRYSIERKTEQTDSGSLDSPTPGTRETTCTKQWLGLHLHRASLLGVRWRRCIPRTLTSPRPRGRRPRGLRRPPAVSMDNNTGRLSSWSVRSLLSCRRRHSRCRRHRTLLRIGYLQGPPPVLLLPNPIQRILGAAGLVTYIRSDAQAVGVGIPVRPFSHCRLRNRTDMLLDERLHRSGGGRSGRGCLRLARAGS